MADTERETYSPLTQELDLAANPTHAKHTQEEQEYPESKYTHEMHWKAPTLMGCSFVAGIVVVLIHHFFYQHWEGRKAGNRVQQQWIIRGGTFFAFAFKMCMALGGGVAYAQFLWMSLRKRQYRVRDVDSMFSVLSNALAFRFLKLWWRVPLLGSVAVLFWLMPIAAIITPGSLTVVLTSEQILQIGPVPSIDFQHQVDNFGTTNREIDDFLAASDDVIRLALASATSGSILPMIPPAPNSSYTTTFPGPALKCSQGTLADLNGMNAAAENYFESSGGLSLAYFAWTPGQADDDHYSYQPLRTPLFNITAFSEPIQSDNDDDFVAPGYNVYIYSQTIDDSSHTGYLIQCTLYNVSYSVNFTYESGSQDLQIHTGTEYGLIALGAPITYSNYDGNIPNPSKDNATISYLSLMYAFGRIVTGSIQTVSSLGTQAAASTLLQSTLLAPTLAINAPTPSSDNATVRAAYEELFQNITMSMFSSSRYLLDLSNGTLAASAPSPTITTTQPVNRYTYNAFDLWLSYGLALAGGAVCLAIGCFALYRNGVAYTNDFSSILRATRKKELSRLVVGSEFNGADPAAEHMLDAMVTYHLSRDRTAGFEMGKEK